MKQFYLFTLRGMTDRFYCGNIYEKLPTDEIRHNGYVITFADCVEMDICKVFSTLKEANSYSYSEEKAMEDSDKYAQNAMYNESRHIY